MQTLTRYNGLCVLIVVLVIISAPAPAAATDPVTTTTRDLRQDPGAFDQVWIAQARPLFDARRTLRPTPSEVVVGLMLLALAIGLLVTDVYRRGAANGLFRSERRQKRWVDYELGIASLWGMR